MRIKFDNEERGVLAGFLYEIRGKSQEQITALENRRREGELTQEKFDRYKDNSDVMLKRLKKLVNKISTPSLFVKLKRRDVQELKMTFSGVIENHANENIPEGGRPFLSDETYRICQSILVKLEDGYERSVSQDRE